MNYIHRTKAETTISGIGSKIRGQNIMAFVELAVRKHCIGEFGGRGLVEFMIALQMYEEICNFEEKALSNCTNIVNSYLPIFAQHGCTLKICREWTNFIKKTSSNERLPLMNGYECQIYCEVQRDGAPVMVRGDDECPFDILAANWVISAISRRWFKLAVDLVPIENFIAEDIEELLESVYTLR